MEIWDGIGFSLISSVFALTALSISRLEQNSQRVRKDGREDWEERGEEMDSTRIAVANSTENHEDESREGNICRPGLIITSLTDAHAALFSFLLQYPLTCGATNTNKKTVLLRTRRSDEKREEKESHMHSITLHCVGKGSRAM